MEEETRVVDVNQMLNETIVNENDKLEELEIGSNERKQAIDAFERFYKLRIEENKESDDYYDKKARREQEMQMHIQKLELEKAKYELDVERLAFDKEVRDKEVMSNKSREKTENLRMWLDIGSKGATLVAWVLMSYKVMKFEETGSIRSKAFTGTIPKLKFW